MYRKDHDPRVRESKSLSKVTFLVVVIIFATWLIASGLQPSPKELYERQQKASTHACIDRNLSDESDSPTMWTVHAGCDANPEYQLKESPTVSSITRYQSPPASQTVLFLDGNGALLKRFAEETACSGLRAIQSADL